MLYQATLVVKSPSGLSPISLPAFVDTGCTGLALMDSTFADKYNIPLLPLSSLYTITLADD